MFSIKYSPANTLAMASRAMPDRIKIIVLYRSPRDVGCSIVELITVKVACDCATKWSRPQESQCNKSMNKGLALLAVIINHSYCQISIFVDISRQPANIPATKR